MVLLKEWRKEDKLILFELPQNNYGSGNHLHDLLAELKLSVPYVFNNHDRASKGGFGNSGSAEHWSPISKIKKGERRKQDDLVYPKWFDESQEEKKIDRENNKLKAEKKQHRELKRLT